MTTTLAAVRDELTEAEFDDGLVVFAMLMTTSAVGLLAVVQLLAARPGSEAAMMLVPAVLTAGCWLRRTRQGRLHRRLEERFGLPWEQLERCYRLGPLQPEVEAKLSEVLALCRTMGELRREYEACLDVAGVEVDGAVEEALDQFIEAVELNRQLDLLQAACARQPGDLAVPAGLAARRERARSRLTALATQLELALAQLAELLGAMVETQAGRDDEESSLGDFTEQVRRLTAALDEAAADSLEVAVAADPGRLRGGPCG